ncbi:hypothetical protein DPMN_083243 [Dreissena polymorpha]|uniref:Uncharacterized protein n=1 Tax=Dreissena polymorpha TaxID=45954 RepID=A0A9D4BI86_DREPO|nr:hypothetical protein DPMN_083243 [Dreissena polymorpha]
MSTTTLYSGGGHKKFGEDLQICTKQEMYLIDKWLHEKVKALPGDKTLSVVQAALGDRAKYILQQQTRLTTLCLV